MILIVLAFDFFLVNGITNLTNRHMNKMNNFDKISHIAAWYDTYVMMFNNQIKSRTNSDIMMKLHIKQRTLKIKLVDHLKNRVTMSHNNR